MGVRRRLPKGLQNLCRLGSTPSIPANGTVPKSGKGAELQPLYSSVQIRPVSPYVGLSQEGGATYCNLVSADSNPIGTSIYMISSVGRASTLYAEGH